jgi:hypothetical protein
MQTLLQEIRHNPLLSLLVFVPAVFMTAQELRIECIFSADGTTENHHRKMFGKASS